MSEIALSQLPSSLTFAEKSGGVAASYFERRRGGGKNDRRKPSES